MASPLHQEKAIELFCKWINLQVTTHKQTVLPYEYPTASVKGVACSLVCIAMDKTTTKKEAHINE